MSVQAITAALAIRGVTPAEKLLLIVLANYADERLECWPSHSRLSRETCMSERNILRLFARLENSGLVVRRKRLKGKMRTTDLISLRIGGDTTSPYGDTMSGRVGTPCRQGGDTMSGEPKRTIREPLRRPALVASDGPAPSPEERAQRAEVLAMAKDLAKQLGSGRKVSA